MILSHALDWLDSHTDDYVVYHRTDQAAGSLVSCRADGAHQTFQADSTEEALLSAAITLGFNELQLHRWVLTDEVPYGRDGKVYTWSCEIPGCRAVSKTLTKQAP